jgi:hypothetical protein
MAKQTIPIEFPPVSQTTERGDGVVIHWTGHRTHDNHPFRWVCASVEGKQSKHNRKEKP